MRILLINPPNTLKDVLGKATVFVSDFEPLGLLYIAAVLEREGIEVEVLDAYVNKMNLDDICKVVETRRPNVVGISCLTANASAVYLLGQRIKENFVKTKVVLGNLHASVFSDVLLKNNVADFIVHGEGEYTMLELVRALEWNKRDFSDIKGLSWLDTNRRVINNEPRPPIKNLDDIPMPARHLVDMSAYKPTAINNYLYVIRGSKARRSMFTSRGCVFQCSFCVVHHQRRYRTYSPERTVDEVKLLVDKYNAGYIFFHDSLFIANKRRVINICDELIRRNLKVRWGCEAHANFADLELFKKMKEAGCYDVAFGIESGVQRLLDNVNKGTTIEGIRKAVKLAKEAKLKVSGLFMLGLPGETRELSLQTIKFATELPLDFAQFNITVPYPGSELFNDLVEQGRIDTGLREDGSIDLRVWEDYSAHPSFSGKDPIYVPEGMTGRELKSLQKLGIRKFFLRPKQIFFETRRIRLDNIGRLLYAFKAAFLER